MNYIVRIDTGEYDLIDGSVEYYGPFDDAETAQGNMRLKYKHYLSADFDIVDRENSFIDGMTATIKYDDEAIAPMHFDVIKLKDNADEDLLRRGQKFILPITVNKKTYHYEIIWCGNKNNIMDLKQMILKLYKHAYAYSLEPENTPQTELTKDFRPSYGWREFSPDRRIREIFEYLSMTQKNTKLLKRVEPVDGMII